MKRRYKSKVNPEKANNTKYSKTTKRHTYNPLVYNNTMGLLGDGSHRGQGKNHCRKIQTFPNRDTMWCGKSRNKHLFQWKVQHWNQHSIMYHLLQTETQGVPRKLARPNQTMTCRYHPAYHQACTERSIITQANTSTARQYVQRLHDHFQERH